MVNMKASYLFWNGFMLGRWRGKRRVIVAVCNEMVKQWSYLADMKLIYEIAEILGCLAVRGNPI